MWHDTYCTSDVGPGVSILLYNSLFNTEKYHSHYYLRIFYSSDQSTANSSAVIKAIVQQGEVDNPSLITVMGESLQHRAQCLRRRGREGLTEKRAWVCRLGLYMIYNVTNHEMVRSYLINQSFFFLFQFLDISNCRLNHIPPTAFSGMPLLSRLNVSMNHIDMIWKNTFENLTRLQELDFSK